MKTIISTLIKTRYIISIVTIVAIFIFISSVIEIEKSHEAFKVLMEKEAYSLAESIERSGNIVITSSEQMEEQLNERLFNIAFFIARMDSIGLVTQADLKEYCLRNNISAISIYDENGNLLLSNKPTLYSKTLIDKTEITKMLHPLFSKQQTSMVLGTQYMQSKYSNHYSVAIRRTHGKGGAILLSVDTESISQLRATLGIGKLMKDIGNNSGIEYILLQDTVGIIAASKAVNEISSIKSDTFLKIALSKDSTLTRFTNYNGNEIFEVVRPLFVDEDFIGLIRIGLSMDELKALESSMKERIIIVTLIIIVLVVLSIIIITVNQSLQISQKRTKDIETFTGNILEQMQDAVVTLDSMQRITIFNKNAEKLFGVSAISILGKSLDEADNLNCMKNIFTSKNPNNEMSIICADNTEHIISVAITKSETSTTAVIRDLTDTKRLQQEIEKKEKLSAMGELAAGVAHEIRNPLNAISMIAQRYEKEFKPARNIKEYKTITEVLLKETQRVNNIVQQFLRFARPPMLKFSNISIKQFVEHIATLFENQAKTKGVVFNYVINQDFFINIDTDQMTQALLNILQNSLDATTEGGKITFNTMMAKEFVVFEIKDTGHGISKDEINKIFNLYYTTKQDGTGMGLAITQQIIDQHNGRIEIKSDIGAGTTFSIYIPIENEKRTSL